MLNTDLRIDIDGGQKAVPRAAEGFTLQLKIGKIGSKKMIPDFMNFEIFFWNGMIVIGLL